MTSTHVFSIDSFEPHSIPAEQLSVLLHLNHALGSSLDLSAVLQVAIEGAVAMLGLDTGAVYLIEEGRLKLGATCPALPSDFPEELREAALEDHPHIGRAVSEGVLLYVDDVAGADLTPAERTVVEARGLTSVLYVPLICDGTAVGAFIVSSCGEVRVLSDADVAICAAMSAASALAIVNVRLFDSLELSHNELIEANARLEVKRDNLRRLADALARAQDEERRRLAIELHDRVSQPLAVMRMRMATWNQRLHPFDVGKEYEQVMSLLDEAITETRSITSEVSPPFLLECGLATAIGWLCERASAVGLECSCSVPSQIGPIDEEVSIFIYQTARELIANAVKHAEASHLDITMTEGERDLVLLVVDDGRGFDPNVRAGSGFGIMSLTERAHLFGADLSIDSAPGEGTRTRLTVTLR